MPSKTQRTHVQERMGVMDWVSLLELESRMHWDAADSGQMFFLSLRVHASIDGADGVTRTNGGSSQE